MTRLGVFWPCESLEWARFTCTLTLCIVPWLYVPWQRATRWPFHPVVPWAIAALPPLWFFGFLYYTDVPSVCTVLAALAAAESQRHGVAAALGFLSLWFRQNNIVWVVFIMGAAMVAELQREARVPMHTTPPWHRQLRRAAVWARVLPVTAPYVPTLLSFGVFLWWNRGALVLGDVSHHQVGFHAAQLNYLAAFAMLFGWPAFLPALQGRWRPAHYVLATTVLVISALAVRYGTVVHPFLLADNRHYPFYVWRRLLNVRPWARYMWVPLYTVSALAMYRALAHTRCILWILGWLAATCLALVPSPLLEPRYFLLPYLVARWQVRQDPRSRLPLVELAQHVLVNVVTLWVFTRHPFVWPHERGVQRFMW